MKKLGYAGLSTMLCLAFALPALAQTPSKEELACNAKYGKFYADQKNMQLFDDFVKDATCKDSMYREGAFSVMSQQLVMASNWKAAMELTTRFTNEIPNAKPESKVYVYSQGLTAATQTGDADKMIEFGEKVLSVKADDLNAMLIVATTIPEKLPTDAAAMDKALTRAMELAKKLIAMTKPAAVDEKVWQMQVIGPAHGVNGFVYLQKTQYPEAGTEFDQAVKANPKDQMSWYRYGLSSVKIAIAAQNLIAAAYDEVNNNRTPGPDRDAAIAKRDAIEKDYTDKRDKTTDLLVSAVALPDPNIAKAARVTLESLWKPSHNNSLDGLDDAIAKRKTELK